MRGGGDDAEGLGGRVSWSIKRRDFCFLEEGEGGWGEAIGGNLPWLMVVGDR